MPGGKFVLTRRHALLGALSTAFYAFPSDAQDTSFKKTKDSGAGPLGTPQKIQPQPYFANVKRAVEALANLGAPIAAPDVSKIALLSQQSDYAAVNAADQILDRYTLARVFLDADGTGHVGVGGAERTLVEQGWRMFLVRIANVGGRTDNVNFTSLLFGGPPTMSPPGMSQRAYLRDSLTQAPRVKAMWLMSQLYEAETMVLHAYYGYEVSFITLSGLPIEYRIIQLFSRDAGRRSGSLTYYLFPKSASFFNAGHRDFEFDCIPSRTVSLNVSDADGHGCVASLIIRDGSGRVYPPQAMRLAPDMFFQSQIYRGDGETILLPDGVYQVESSRGPEYMSTRQTVAISANAARIDLRLQRWIDPAKWGWYSGDTHLHAAGCAHYQNPTEGVSPESMIRQARGEGLAIAEVLSWGAGGWYHQKQFFTGGAISPSAGLEEPELQAANNVTWQPRPTAEDSETSLRYDVEVSGFPSSHAGHLVLMRLKDQDYPGTTLIEQWPSWNLPILQWARAQGALVGYAHCGSGMVVDSAELPNFEIPPMSGVGAQEAIVDVTHGAIDFLSGCDTNPIAELNAWYHMMNCGFRLAMLGETDYPCISAERMGMGRSYVRLDRRPVGNAGYEAWVHGIEQGRLYCGDGRSHFLDFKVSGRRSGEGDLALIGAGTLEVEALVAARLEQQPPPDIEEINRVPYGEKWHLENARIGTTRTVPVELIVNGLAVEKAILVADGNPRTIKFSTHVERSSWLALRILPSSHTHPVFVKVAGKPIRASRRSAKWCRECVDKVWEVKSPFMRVTERPAAADAFDHARNAYDAIFRECEVD